MDCQILYKQEDHIWYAFGQDPAKPDNIIDSNQIVICSGKDTVLLDPGGVEIFPSFLAALTEKVSIETIKHIFLSHQDPDIGSSLSLWRRICNPDVKIYLPWMWSSFVAHFDAEATLISVPDEGMTIRLSNGRSLDMVPAHFLHSPGNLNMYDPRAEMLFTGDIGAALLPSGPRKSFYVDRFDQHIQYMEGFHQRWMGYVDARDAWIEQARRLAPKVLVPQHGLCFKDDNVDRFLDWLGNLEIGAGVAVMRDGAKLAEAPTASAALPKPASPKPVNPKPASAAPTSAAPASAAPASTKPAAPAPASTKPVAPAPEPGNADGSLVIKQDAPLFARIGGDPAIDVVVDAFYSHVLADPRLSSFFENVDARHLKAAQKKFMAAAFGGPVPYTGPDLQTAHARLVADGLNGSHFDIVAKHLLDVLTNFQVDAQIIDEIMTIVGSTKGDILKG